MNDYDKVSKLVLWERQARVRHLHDDLVACYWPDARSEERQVQEYIG